MKEKSFTKKIENHIYVVCLINHFVCLAGTPEPFLGLETSESSLQNDRTTVRRSDVSICRVDISTNDRNVNSSTNDGSVDISTNDRNVDFFPHFSTPNVTSKKSVHQLYDLSPIRRSRIVSSNKPGKLHHDTLDQVRFKLDQVRSG